MLVSNQGCMMSCPKLNGKPNIKPKIASHSPKMYPFFRVLSTTQRPLKTNP